MHDLDFLWLLIDVSCQLLKHFPLIGMNTELQPKHKQFKSNYRYILNFNGEILAPLQIMILTLNSHWPFSRQRRSIRLRRIIHLQYPSKLTEKQMDKGRTIRKVMGGGEGKGNFRAAAIFFSLSNSLY